MKHYATAHLANFTFNHRSLAIFPFLKAQVQINMFYSQILLAQ